MQDGVNKKAALAVGILIAFGVACARTEPRASPGVASLGNGDGQVAGKKKVLLLAGSPSHGYGSHDHKAGCHLLADHLNASGLPIEARVHFPGWPQDPKAFDGIDAVVIYSDGANGHPAVRHLEEATRLASRGVGPGF